MVERNLKDTTWLARRLGLSQTTVERLRKQDPDDLPPHLVIGRSIRYDEAVVERWLAARGGVETITAPEDAHARRTGLTTTGSTTARPTRGPCGLHAPARHPRSACIPTSNRWAACSMTGTSGDWSIRASSPASRGPTRPPCTSAPTRTARSGCCPTPTRRPANSPTVGTTAGWRPWPRAASARSPPSRTGRSSATSTAPPSARRGPTGMSRRNGSR